MSREEPSREEEGTVDSYKEKISDNKEVAESLDKLYQKAINGEEDFLLIDFLLYWKGLPEEKQAYIFDVIIDDLERWRASCQDDQDFIPDLGEQLSKNKEYTDSKGNSQTTTARDILYDINALFDKEVNKLKLIDTGVLGGIMLSTVAGIAIGVFVQPVGVIGAIVGGVGLIATWAARKRASFKSEQSVRIVEEEIASPTNALFDVEHKSEQREALIDVLHSLEEEVEYLEKRASSGAKSLQTDVAQAFQDILNRIVPENLGNIDSNQFKTLTGHALSQDVETRIKEIKCFVIDQYKRTQRAIRDGFRRKIFTGRRSRTRISEFRQDLNNTTLTALNNLIPSKTIDGSASRASASGAGVGSGSSQLGGVDDRTFDADDSLGGQGASKSKDPEGKPSGSRRYDSH